jgi:hypothetical protein
MQTSFAGGLMTPSDDNRDRDGSTGTPLPGTLLPPTGYNQHGSTSIFEGFTSRGNSFAEGLELVSAAADHHRSLLSSFQDPILTSILTMEDAENLVLLCVWGMYAIGDIDKVSQLFCKPSRLYLPSGSTM